MNPDTETPWQYKPDGQQQADNPLAGNQSSESTSKNSRKPANMSWTASEYVEHHHSAGWYMMLLVGTGALGAGVYFLTKDYFATGVIAVLGVIVAVFAGRKPRQVTYEITSSSLKIGEKSYPYSQFRSFAIVREGNLSSVNLLPLKRFMTPISAYFAAEDEKLIVDALGEHLPLEERKLDGIDRLTSRLRF